MARPGLTACVAWGTSIFVRAARVRLRLFLPRVKLPQARPRLVQLLRLPLLISGLVLLLLPRPRLAQLLRLRPRQWLRRRLRRSRLLRLQRLWLRRIRWLCPLRLLCRLPLLPGRRRKRRLPLLRLRVLLFRWLLLLFRRLLSSRFSRRGPLFPRGMAGPRQCRRFPKRQPRKQAHRSRPRRGPLSPRHRRWRSLLMMGSALR